MAKMTYPITKTGKWTIRAVNNNIMIESQLSDIVDAISVDKCAVRLIDIFPNPSNNGIFTIITNQNTRIRSLLNNFINGNYLALDEEYIFNHSGQKTISLLLENYVKRGWKGSSLRTLLTDQMIANIISIILNRFDKKWEKLAQTFRENYDILNPYRIELDETYTSGEINSNKVTNHGEDTNTLKRSGDDTTSTIDMTTVSENKQSAYNSSTYSPNSIDTDTTNGKNLTLYNSTFTNTYTHGHKVDDNETKNRTDTRNFTRKGNIGNLTNQELIEKEREFLNYQVLNTIFEDMDSILTREYYH